MPIVPVSVRAPGGLRLVDTYALLDSGSTSTFCREGLLDALGVQGMQRPLTLSTMHGEKKTSSSRTADLEVVTDSGSVVALKGVRARPFLPIGPEYRGTTEDTSPWPHLRDVPLKPPLETDVVGLLIGVDAPDALRPLTTVTGGPGQPFAVKTELGWTVTGPLQREQCQDAANCGVSAVEESARGAGGADPEVGSNRPPNAEDLAALLRRFWDPEDEDIYDSTKGRSVQDQAVMDLWKKKAVKVDGHYQLPIPFKKQRPDLPNDEEMALSRLTGLRRRLSKDPGLHEKYREGIQALLDAGHAEEVPGDEIGRADGKVWYLPHHGVSNPSKEKLRIVFDCAAKHQQVSLNSEVLQGPDLTNSLLGVLTRFRLHPVAFMADVEAMFHQVRVPKEDRDVLRFWWFPDGNLDASPRRYRMKVHLFGGTWSPSVSSHALRLAAAADDTGEKPAIKEAVLHNFYVDDCLKSAGSPQEAKELAQGLQKKLMKGGFRLTKWTSNSEEVLDAFPQEERSKEARSSSSLPSEEKALGVYWNVEDDAFTFKVIPMEKPLTRRGVLSMVSSVYDPLGFASPFILKARLLVQELARRRMEWDQPIEDESLLTWWNTWVESLPAMTNIRVPRCLHMKDEEARAAGPKVSSSLHHFADASEDAYGVVSYLRTQHEDGTVHTSLVMAKSRLAPLKPLTIPRLELQAATLATKQDEMLRRELGLELEPSQFWTDSTTVLRYIANEERRFQTFVANRVTEIRGRTEVQNWHYIPTAENPADDTSRGTSPAELSDPRWLTGPAFLKQPPEKWPALPYLDPVESEDPEVKSPPVCLATVAEVDEPLERLLRYYSDWTQMRRAVARLLLCRDALLARGTCTRELRPQDLNRAEKAILRLVQTAAFPDEIKALEEGRSLAKSSPLRQHSPKLKEGLILSTGRLKHSTLPEFAMCPYVLPASHPVATVIARHYHVRAGHAGRDFTLAEVRQRYWILKGRTMIQAMIRSCIPCRRRAAQPCAQMMADLPEDRVAPGGPAFVDVGVDYFGPFYTHRGRGRTREKRYGCLFTCLSSRAVHLEMADDLSTSSFLNCLARFTARRGKPATLRSDNGTNFVGAERELREALAELDHGAVARATTEQGIEWSFNPPQASHMGGVWERQIRTVRRVLAGLTDGQNLKDETLHTLLVAVEGIVNNRPLVPVSDDPTSLEALTPNQLLVLRAGEGPRGAFTQPDLRRRWRQVQYLVNTFWQRWLREYLPTLRRRTKWTEPERNVAVGDLVIVMDFNAPRDEWRLGRVTETLPGDDGLVRVARVYTRGKTIERPISRLCLLEATGEPTQPARDA